MTGLPKVGRTSVSGDTEVAPLQGGPAPYALGSGWQAALSWADGLPDTFPSSARPWLLVEAARMSGCLAFISTVGGSATFGMAGIIIGPVLAAPPLSVRMTLRANRGLHAVGLGLDQPEKRRA